MAYSVKYHKCFALVMVLSQTGYARLINFE
jgi:hypothetical protein